MRSSSVRWKRVSIKEDPAIDLGFLLSLEENEIQIQLNEINEDDDDDDDDDDKNDTFGARLISGFIVVLCDGFPWVGFQGGIEKLGNGIACME